MNPTTDLNGWPQTSDKRWPRCIARPGDSSRCICEHDCRRADIISAPGPRRAHQAPNSAVHGLSTVDGTLKQLCDRCGVPDATEFTLCSTYPVKKLVVEGEVGESDSQQDELDEGSHGRRAGSVLDQHAGLAQLSAGPQRGQGKAARFQHHTGRGRRPLGARLPDDTIGVENSHSAQHMRSSSHQVPHCGACCDSRQGKLLRPELEKRLGYTV